MKIKEFIKYVSDECLLERRVYDDIQQFVLDPKQSVKYVGKKDYMSPDSFKNIIDKLDDINDDPIYIHRVITALISASAEYNWLCEVNIERLLAYYPNFHTLIGKTTERILYKIFDDHCWEETQLAFYAISKVGLPDDKVLHYLLHGKHYLQDSHREDHDLYLMLYLQAKIRNAYKNKDFNEFDAVLREYIVTSLKNYPKEIKCFSTRHYSSYTALPKEASDRFIALLDGTGDWETDIASIASQLVTAENSESYLDRKEFSLIHYETIKTLMDFILDINVFHHAKESKYLQNFSNIIKVLDINMWITQLGFFSNYRKHTISGISKIMEDLNRAITLYPKNQPDFIRYLIHYFNANYNDFLPGQSLTKHKKKDINDSFNDNVYIRLLTLLCHQFGGSYIWDCYYDNDLDKSKNDITYGLLPLISPTPDIMTRKDRFEQALLKEHIPLITKNQIDSDLLLHFVLTGEMVGNVTTLTLGSSNIKHLCWLSLPYFERLTMVFFNGKNDKLAASFIESGANDYCPTPLRRLSDIIIKHPHCEASYVIGLVNYVQHVHNESRFTLESSSIVYKDVCYSDLFPKMELAYLQKHNIACLKHLKVDSLKLKMNFLICLNSAIIDPNEALLLIDMFEENNKPLNAALLACIHSLPDDLKKIVFSSMIEQLNEFKGQKEINAIECLCRYDLSKKALFNVLDKINEPQSRVLLINTGALSFFQLYPTPDGNFDLANYLKHNYQAPKAYPVNEELLALIKTKDGSSAIDTGTKLMQIYQGYDGFEPNSEANAIISQITESSFDDFMCHLITQHEESTTFLNYWLLSVPTLHITPTTLRVLMPVIERWSSGEKRNLAIRFIKQMAGSGLPEVFTQLDKLRETTNKKTIKETINDVFMSRDAHSL